MTPHEADQLKKQNAMLMRALLRVKAERDALLKQISNATGVIFPADESFPDEPIKDDTVAVAR